MRRHENPLPDGLPTPEVVGREAYLEHVDDLRGQVRELSHFHSRDVTYATFCEGPYDESVRYRDFMGWDVPWYSARDNGDAFLHGRGFGLQACYLRDGDRVFETWWTTGRGAESMAPAYALLDHTVYGRQETWQEVPPGWPQRFAANGQQFRLDGRPTPQWDLLAAGRSDDLGTDGTPAAEGSCCH